MPNRVTVRVKDNRLYFFSYSYFLIHFFFLFLGLRVRVSAISHITVITVTHQVTCVTCYYHTEEHRRFQNNDVISYISSI